MDYTLRFSLVSMATAGREVNEDNFIANRIYRDVRQGSYCRLTGEVKVNRNSKPVFGVFDGMGGGGMSNASVASLLAAQNAEELVLDDLVEEDEENQLYRFFVSTNEDILQFAYRHGIMYMGTTAALAVFTPKRILIANAGDTRIYEINDRDMRQITKDHVLPEYEDSPLTQYLGMHPYEGWLDPYIVYKQSISPGERYLICSDGVYGYVNDENMREIILSSEGYIEKVEEMISRAIANGSMDDMTCVLLEIQCNMEDEKSARGKQCSEQ